MTKSFERSKDPLGTSATCPANDSGDCQKSFFATSKRLQLAQKPDEKLALLNELQRIEETKAQAHSLGTITLLNKLNFHAEPIPTTTVLEMPRIGA